MHFIIISAVDSDKMIMSLSYRDKTESMYSETQKEWLDLTEPLYAASALYAACRSARGEGGGTTVSGLVWSTHTTRMPP